MIVIDTSAVIAILGGEPEASTFLDAINLDAERAISSATFVELTIVARRLRRSIPPYEFLSRYKIAIHPFDEAQAHIAAEAYRRYGRGNHKAALNFGDCFAYALAKSLDAPLLFRGTDFAATDVLTSGP